MKVEGVAVVKRHQRANPGANKPGGIIEREAYVNISNVQLIDPANGKPTRVRYDVAEDGSKTRVASGSGQPLDKESRKGSGRNPRKRPQRRRRDP